VASPRSLEFGFSPCPNDTFAFWAAVAGVLPGQGLSLRPWLADIEALNARAVAGKELLPVTKLSLPALASVADKYAVLPAGAALAGLSVDAMVTLWNGASIAAQSNVDRITIQ